MLVRDSLGSDTAKSALFAAFSFLAVWIWWADSYVLTVVLLALVGVIGSLGLNVALGNAGIFSLAHAAFFAVGAYGTFALMNLGVPSGLAPLAAVAICVLLSFLFGALTLRLGELYFALVTLALVQIAQTLAHSLEFMTGGANGLALPGPLSIGAWEITGQQPLLIFVVLVATFLLFANYRVLRSRMGRAMRAVRDDDLAAAGIGIQVQRVRNLSFMVHAFHSSIAGALFGFVVGYVSPGSFRVDLSVILMAMLILGGSGSIMGAVIGVIILSAASEFLRASSEYRLLLYGLVIVFIGVLAPEGLVGLARHFGRRYRTKPEVQSNPDSTASAKLHDSLSRWGVQSGIQASVEAGPLVPTKRRTLRASAISKRFGGVAALTNVSIEIRAGEISGLIGPNGSGKSTLLNVIGGLIRPDSGSVSLSERDVTKLPPHRMAQLGVSRTYQNGRLFQKLSVFENIVVAGDIATRSVGPLGGAASTMGSGDWANWVIDLVGIRHLAKMTPLEIGFGSQRLVELARALATNPSFLLADEPVAGLTASEAEHVASCLQVAAANGLGILLIEHDIAMVVSIADEITVLDAGLAIAKGTAHEIQTNPKVIEAYLGI